MTSSVAPPDGRSMTCVHSQGAKPERRHLYGTFASLHTIASSGRCDSNGADGNTIDMLLKFGMNRLPSAKQTHVVIAVRNTAVRQPRAVLDFRGGGIASKYVVWFIQPLPPNSQKCPCPSQRLNREICLALALHPDFCLYVVAPIPRVFTEKFNEKQKNISWG